MIAPVALARAAGMSSGSIVSAIAVWIVSHSAAYTAIALVVGFVAGDRLGRMIGRCLFPAPKGQTVVVRKGRRSLPVTLRAALPAALTTAMIGSIVVGVSAQPGSVALLAGIAVLIGIVIGVVLAVLSSLS